MTVGVACVLFLGSIDLSNGSVASCSAVLVTVLLPKMGVAAFPVVALYGVAAGFGNGYLHTKLRVPSFIATLCTQAVWQSAALLISGGQPLTMIPKVWPLLKWGKVSFGPIPLLFLISFVVMLIYYWIQMKTSVGRSMMAIGNNEKAARLIGLKVAHTKLIAFILSGFGAALAGILFAVKLKSGIPTVGVQYNLMSIAAAVLGGVLLTGGKGNMLFTFIGVLLITSIQNGMNVIAVDGFWQKIVFGLIVVVAIYINSDRNNRRLVVK
jgi:ribose/xylose/arabinose/galactoside ABC-type transport system permease subunit